MVLTYHTEALEGYYTIFSFPKYPVRREINALVLEIYTVGDCKEPRLIVDAIADGLRIARAI